MREPERDPGRISDILEAIDNVSEFISGCDRESFLKDKIRYFAIVKNIEIIGEAAYMLSLDFKAAHPEVGWEQIIKMRHVLVHGYACVQPDIVWETAINDVPALKKKILQFKNPQ